MDEAMSVQSPHGNASQLSQTLDPTKDTFVTSQQSIDIDRVINLVKTLYNSQNPNEQNEANKSLTALQASPYAWQICWQLLDPDHNHLNEVHFFAANLLVLKINQSWSQQDEAWLESQLRTKLFDTLVKYAASPCGTKLVTDRLALALANFALHSIPTFWPDAIEEIVKTFTDPCMTNSIPHQRICDILMKILTYIPEEYSVMLPNPLHRATLNGRISESGPIVFKFLHGLLQSDNITASPESKQAILKCLTSWVMHSQTSLLELEDGKSLMNSIYELVIDSDLCGSACAALAATFDSRKAENYRNSIIEFIPKLANLKSAIDKFIAEEEVECVIKTYSLVINFCENHSKLMVKIVLEDNIPLEGSIKDITKQSIFTLIKMVLDCTAAPGIFGIDEKYSEITLTFWFSFFEVFYYYADSYSDAICDLFDPLVDSLTQILIRKSQYPPASTYNNVWNDDQREEYRRYRHDLGDVLSMVVQFPRARSRIFKQLQGQLEQELQSFVRFNQTQDITASQANEPPWQGLEAIIHALKSMSESVPFDEDEFIPKVFDAMDQIPFSYCQSVELYCTSTEMIAAYSDWLFTHTSYLSTALKILFLGVTAPNSYVRLMATMSLKDITSECQTVLQPYAQNIVKSCMDAVLIHGHLLETMEKARLMHTLGCAIVMTPQHQIGGVLARLTEPILSDLTVKAQLDPSSDPTCRPVIFDRLHMLNSLVESLHIKQCSDNEYEDADENHLDISSRFNLDSDPTTFSLPAITLLKQLIPILKIVVEKYRNDEEIMGKVSETVKKSAKNLNIEIKPILKDLMEVLISAYDPLLNFSIIQDTVPLFNIFRVDSSVRDFLRDAFANITKKTLSYCLANPLRQLSVTVEVYFRFAYLVCKKFFVFLSEQPSLIDIDLLYKLALASLELPEKKTLTEVSNFLTMFRMKSWGEPHLHRIFVIHLDQLITSIFSIFGGNYSTPKNAIDTVTDMAFFIFDADEAREVLDRVVEREGFPTDHVSREEKQRFVSSMLQEAKRKNRRKFKDTCTEFALRTRNLNRVL